MTFEPARTALLMIDMQMGFIGATVCTASELQGLLGQG